MLLTGWLHRKLWLWLNRKGAFKYPALRKYISPFPPVELMENVSGLRNEEHFASHGADIYHALSKASPKPLTKYKDILDFGCGCGRLARMFKGHPFRVSGCDIDKRHVQWVRENLPFIDASVSELHAPLPYPANRFDCIVSISVFSHLNEASQDEFLSELHRISRPGSSIFLSIHGENAMKRAIREKQIREMLAIDEAPFQIAKSALRDGRHAFILQHGHLTNDGFEYGISFIPRRYIESHWTRWFEIVDFRAGAIHDFQDVVVLRPIH